MLTKRQFIKYIREGDFRELFITELGWDRYRGPADISITVDDVDFHIRVIAHKKGFQILHCDVDELPTQSIAKKIDTKLRKQAMDYICIFHKRNTVDDVWVVPVRTNEKRSLVLVEYSDDKIDFLYQKIDGFSFDYDDDTNIVDLRAKVQTAFAVNSEKITKDFYAGFKKHHKAFTEFITGMDDNIAPKENRSKQWYASVMLNRLMFCYFIQKKGFLDQDVDYLRHKLNWVRENEGNGKFYDFYRGFLRQLFHDGLNAPQHSSEFRKTYGRIPYLNGGMFEHHILERRYPEIDIPDEAFEGLFKFFDEWRWHLDTRMTASGKDINPDVLGYIFEQYINDRAQMGAYYTKEDITEYIGRNCILPFLFDKVKNTTKESYKDFEPDGFVWRSLRESGDRYIFDAVKKGYKDFDSIPDNIKCGVITPEMHKEYAETPVGKLPEGHVPLAELRKDWNTKTTDTWGLPNEIWRESIERMQRCHDILGKIERGNITSINDFITYNLDIRSFASDLLLKSEDSVFVKHFYEALKSVTILDPTCGSGAFLFAAMNILEPLYEICITRMQEMNEGNPHLFKKELEEINSKYRSNIQYFIYKSIILRNLYGVDIMAEATEIAKLRLFLKMVAVVDVDQRAENLGLDPLPDIDFNIRCGNTLVGYANKQQLEDAINDKDGKGSLSVGEANKMLKATIEEELELVSAADSTFKDLQFTQDEDPMTFKTSKNNLRTRMNSLNDKLNQRMYLGEFGMNVQPGEKFTESAHYQEWLKSHQPFHWFAEFYHIISTNHGFDVIIGNPPYVEYNKKNAETGKTVAEQYKVNCTKTIQCSNLYAFVIERCFEFTHYDSNLSLIIPLSIITTERMQPLRKIVLNLPEITLFVNLAGDWHPGKLFEGVRSQFTIMTSIKTNHLETKVYSTDYMRWYNSERPQLFTSKTSYTLNPYKSNETIYPKIGARLEVTILDKFKGLKGIYELSRSQGNVIHYRNAGIAYYNICITFEQYFYINQIKAKSSTLKDLFFDNLFEASGICALINSNLFALLYFLFSDCYHLTVKDMTRFKFPLDCLSPIADINDRLMKSIDVNSIKKSTTYKTKGLVEYQEFYPRFSKPIIDEIDTVLARHYGFTEEELDFIINYDIKYRMGDELNAE